jgi:Bacterial RNA polymerase, alpha chain C terminal domain
VTVHTTMNITGRPAQFGRGVMVEVGGKIIEKFATNLAAQLATGSPAAQPATDSTAAQPATDSTAAQPATDDQSADAPTGAAPPTSSELAAAAAARNGSVPGEEYSGDTMGLPIEELNLPVRSYNSLRREGVHTVGALASRNEKDLLAIDGLGPQSVKEIKQRLADHGLALGEPGAPPAIAAGAGQATGGSNATGAGQAAGNGPGADRAAAAGATTPDPSAPAPSPRDRNGFRPPPAARPADEDAIDLLSVAGLPVLKRALPGVGILVGLLLLLGLRSRRKRRRARAAGA